MVKKPDRLKFLEALDNAVDVFIDNSKNVYNNIIAISHNDADGISSLQIIQNLLHKLKKNFDYFIYNRSVSWAAYLNGILPKRHTEKTALIFTDVGSTLTELIPIITKRKEHFFILDHHEVENDVGLNDLPENLFFVNPTVYGFDGLDHIAGATLAYMFAKQISPSITNHAWLTAIGIAGDSLRSMDRLESFNREVYQELIDEELIEDREGLILFGGMHNSIKNGLKYSILPFVKQLGGEGDENIKSFLNQLQINPNKKTYELEKSEIEAIQKIPLPHNLKSLQSFLGKTNFIRRFIPNYAEIAKPIQSLLKKDAKFVWQEDNKKAFQEIKCAIARAPVLVSPDYSKDFHDFFFRFQRYHC